ncbi:hypothetical protein N7522_000596 [Penicillium canescens]|uniref:HAT C-terminal dimerisation domain-containing protein n=1 Tax=Penicillium canescens TaxID=5083 RepID=A0AAD6IAT6_PENCN|nr:hypothetical protein N7522_000596 [Penicillium canescens]KAJ6039207.1 hypothetical protein N7460_007239 [Penicillium canescens]
MSQLSDVYPSSSFDTQDGLPLDALQYLIPDDSLSHRQSKSQLPSESQFDSALDLPDNRVQIRTASQAPDTLPRIRPDCINEFIICIPAMSAEFVKWWLHTDYALVAVVQNAGKGFNKLQMPKMESQALYAITAVQFSRIQLRTILERRRCRNISMDQGADSDYRRRVLVVSINYSVTRPREDQRLPSPNEHGSRRFLILSLHRNYPSDSSSIKNSMIFLSYARLAPTPPSVPSRKVIRERLRSFVIEYQQETLQRLPSSAKLSLALDCWTSPFQDAFMAITGYFIDQEWEYREVLLGFEPLSGTHSGVNLGEVVLQILQKHQITDRVLAVTTDNASNNKTLIAAVNDSIRELQLKTDSTIIQVPCLAHIIQLSLIDLLGKIKASPKNDTAESVWSDERVRLLRARQQKHKIADTLNKVRGLAVYINGSPQRKEAFLNLQSNGQKLVPIQDVRTRWNSTFLMLRRAKGLHITFDEYCSYHDQPHFALSAEGWRQIDYLLYILQPFFTFTTLVCQTKDSSIHLVFSIYNRLFDHLERSIRQLRRKKVAWKQLMLSSLEAAKDKLSKYYGMTDNVEGDLYAIGTILDPSNKMEFFSTSDWAPDNSGKDYKKEYRESLQSLFERYSLRIPSDMTQSDSRLSTNKSALERACRRDLSKPSTGPQYDELTRYLQSDTIDESARIFWRNHEKEFPILASITRDVMSIPATGAGVERLFNSARDVCHYRRGSLNPETVRDIMLYLCTTRFDIKEEQRLILQEYLSEQEIAATSEELNIEIHCSEAISDTEEDVEMYLDIPAALPLSEVAAGKRPAVTFDDEEDANADKFADPEENSPSPLPDTQHRVSV